MSDLISRSELLTAFICPKNHDANNPYWRIPDNTDKLKYCPYCGKKIKIVGD